MKILFLTVLLFSSAISAKLCKQWGEHKEIGILDHNFIDEASGIIVSKYEDRLYHVNDSGDGPFFYQTSLDGSFTKKIKVKGFTPKDVESMAYGKCWDSNCLVLADVGDNEEDRKNISFVIIKEQENFSKKVSPLSIITAKYPHHAHNVEGVAMHPNGNIYILTKSIDYDNNRAAPSKIYVLTKEQWQSETKKVKTLSYLGKLDLPYYLYNFNLWGRIVTGFDIHSSGSKLLISTYGAAIELKIDLSRTDLLNTRNLELGKDITITPLMDLMQIESISYLNDDSYLYTTEYHKKQGPSPIVKVQCLDKALQLL